MKKVVKLGIFVLIVIGLVAGAITLVKKRKEEDKKIPTAEIFPIIVKSLTLKEKNITTTLPYLATVKNDKNIVITSKFPGRVLYIKNLGDKIKKGEVVAKIDSSELKAKLAEINSNISSIKSAINAQKITLDNTQKIYYRTKVLYKVKMASLNELESLQNKIALLKAQIKANEEKLKALRASKKSIENSLTYTNIISPVSGIVSAKLVNIGDNAAPFRPILKIASNSGNYLFIMAKNAKEILYKNEIYPLTPLNETVNSLKTYKANVDDKTLISGEKVNVKLITYKGKGYLIPFDAVLSIDGNSYVFDIDGKMHKLDVVAQGVEGLVVKSAPSQIIKANPDILLKIKAGYPFKLMENVKLKMENKG
ncbi:efflux RND transporter periplasmic adaptor subunit [Caminibacter sp.]